MVVDLSPANIAAVLEKAIGTSYVPLEWTSVQLRMMLNVARVTGKLLPALPIYIIIHRFG